MMADEMPFNGTHYCRVLIDDVKGNAIVRCDCGASWTLNAREVQREEYKVEDHQRYAMRALLKPD